MFLIFVAKRSRFDLSAKERYSNFNATLTELLKIGVLPILNENDSVAVEELR
jgi:glutamate 5-kinase